VAALAWGFALTLAGERAGRRAVIAAGLIAFGIAGLAKDPLGALAPPLTLALALALAGRIRPFRRWLSWPALAAGMVLGLGWWVVAEVRTPGTLWYTVVDNHVLNVIRARRFPDEDVPLGALEFVVVATLGALPWSIGAVVGIVDVVRRRAWRSAAETPWVALALWAVGVFALTALSGFRLPHYGLPAYPALALLAVRAWQRTDPRPLVALHAAIFAALAVACAAIWTSDGRAFMDTIIGAADVASRKAQAAGQASAFPSWEAIRPLLGVAAIVLGAGALVTAAALFGRRTASRTMLAAVTATMLALMPAAATAMALMSAHRAVRDLALAVAERAGPDDLVAVEGPIEGAGAFEWYSGRRPLIVDGRRSVLAFGATTPGAGSVFWDRQQLAAAWTEGRRLWVATTRDPGRTLVAALPGAALVLATPGRWLYVNPEDRPLGPERARGPR
jgi:hypothetical protein